jgi:predicted transcriptional regulator
MKQREAVSHIMTSQMQTANITQTIEEVKEMMDKNNIRHIPVVSGDQLTGIVSNTDIMRASYIVDYDGGSVAIYNGLSLEKLMVKNVESVEADTPIKDAAEILVNKEFHALPVTENGKLVGIVTTTDLVKYLLEQY